MFLKFKAKALKEISSQPKGSFVPLDITDSRTYHHSTGTKLSLRQH